MKKFLLLAASVLTFISCEKDNKTGNLHLSGDIKGLGQGKLYIQKIQDTALVILDSIEFKGNSKFDTYVNIDEPEVLYLFLDRGQTNSIDNNMAFFAEPGEMNITTKLKEFYAAAKVTGSKNQELWEEFKQMNSRFTNENLEIMEKRLYNEMNFNPKTQDSINEAYNRLLTRKYRYVANFAVTHADHEIAPFLALTEIADINIAFLDTISKKMSPKIKKSKYGKMLDEHIENRKKEN
ncbi:DUF4369 domain-containing protein [Flavobacterium chuncheonense]|uniref:DUF4369 domain-containing protein n=1 Tax=Flavobacterium chuncheonense TaxID=2026653 RepID=A0ABW5YKC8_9FLAO